MKDENKTTPDEAEGAQLSAPEEAEFRPRNRRRRGGEAGRQESRQSARRRAVLVFYAYIHTCEDVCTQPCYSEVCPVTQTDNEWPLQPEPEKHTHRTAVMHLSVFCCQVGGIAVSSTGTADGTALLETWQSQIRPVHP